MVGAGGSFGGMEEARRLLSASLRVTDILRHAPWWLCVLLGLALLAGLFIHADPKSAGAGTHAVSHLSLLDPGMTSGPCCAYLSFIITPLLNLEFSVPV